jgi:hypothetical protein
MKRRNSRKTELLVHWRERQLRWFKAAEPVEQVWRASMHCRQARGRRFWALTAWMTASLVSVACAPSGKYIWVENYKQPRDTSAT